MTINLNELLKNLLPSIWKTTPVDENDNAQWLISLIKPIKQLLSIFTTKRDNSFYDLQHSGQLLVLEHYINIYFGLTFSTSVQNDIYISDNTSYINRPYLYQNEEQKYLLINDKVYLYQNAESTPLYIYQTSEYLDIKNFIINVPVAFQTSYPNFEYTISYIVNKYKTAGFEFEIVYY